MPSVSLTALLSFMPSGTAPLYIMCFWRNVNISSICICLILCRSAEPRCFCVSMQLESCSFCWRLYFSVWYSKGVTSSSCLMQCLRWQGILIKVKLSLIHSLSFRLSLTMRQKSFLKLYTSLKMGTSSLSLMEPFLGMKKAYSIRGWRYAGSTEKLLGDFLPMFWIISCLI